MTSSKGKRAARRNVAVRGGESAERATEGAGLGSPVLSETYDSDMDVSVRLRT